jgi:DNA replication protein DnaC
MTTTDVISPDLKTILRRLKLSRMLDTLPERLTLARQQKLPHQDLLLQVLSDEVTRRDSLAVTLRVQKARLDPTMRLDAWDHTAKVTFDRALLNELATLRFLDAHAHVTIVGPVGVGKTFLAHALGHVACRRGASVLAVRTDQMLNTLKHARLDNSHDAELRTLVAVDLLILDDFAIDVLDPVESRDLYDLLLERYRSGSVIVTSNRGQTNGWPRLPIPSAPRAPSTASPATRTTSSSTANRIGHGSSRGSPRTGRSTRDDAYTLPRFRGGARRQPPVSAGAALDRRRAPAGSPSTRPGGEGLDRPRLIGAPDGASRALRREDNSGGKVLKS